MSRPTTGWSESAPPRRAEATLRRLAFTDNDGLEVAITRIPDGHDASAESNPNQYLNGAGQDSMRTARGS